MMNGLYSNLIHVHSNFIRDTLLASVTLALTLFAAPVPAATVAFDGGITLWVSWDNLDITGASLADTITEADVLPGGFSCDPTNTGRSNVGAPNSPPSCPAMGTCTGEDKITVDLERLADYIWAASEGAHYLRRVYVSDEGRAWDSADIKWNIGLGGSSAPGGGWADADRQMRMQSAYRTCIHDVAHHELGHYFYNLPDRYANSSGYYSGTIGGGAEFDVDVVERDINTVMSNNFPHLFVDTTNARIVVDYNPPGPGTISGEVLTPDLLVDADPANDGPNRAHHGHTMPFAQDEWSLIPTRHADLTGVHTEGNFDDPGDRPAIDIVYIGDDEPHPGTVLLLDRSGSMGVTTSGITAAQFVQEAGMFLYHSSQDDDFVGTYLYNAAVEELFPYAVYDPTNDLPSASFRNASGLTNIAAALERAIDELVDEHGEGGSNGGEIYLMSDGRQTTGPSLWDQVTRANGFGIKIHTFLFGNADTTTMNDIAGGTSGTPTPMSERDDAAELKMIMTRKFATGRGLTPVYVFKGAMHERINVGSTSLYPGTFRVPPKSTELKFYIFQHVGNAAQGLTLQLTDPDGNNFSSPAPNNVADKGRFNAVRADKPKAGLWSFVIAGVPGKPLPSEDVEIAAYADNRELTTRTWWEGFGQLRAQVYFRYPLTKVQARADFYAGGKLVYSVPMFDDGKTAGDVQAEDGIYSASFDYGREKWQKILSRIDTRTDKLRVEVRFEVTEESSPAPLAHYETGTTYEMLLADYKRNRSRFEAFATNVFNLSERDREDKQGGPMITGIDGNGGKVLCGDNGKLVVTIANARPIASQLRVSLGQGVRAKVRGVNGDSVRQDDDDAEMYSKKLAYSKKESAMKAESIEKMEKQRPILQIQQNGDKSTQKVTYSTTFVIEYEVDPKAEAGPRSLILQFGDVRLEWPKAIDVDC